MSDQQQEQEQTNVRTNMTCQVPVPTPVPTPTYDELKIRDGPIYAPLAPERNKSNECLLEYERQQQLLQQARAEREQRSSNSTTTFSPEPRLSPTTSTSQLDDYFAPHKPAPLKAETTALLIVDVQPEYWSHCPAVRKDFPEFPKRLQKTIEICRQRRAKIIWVRADYRYSHSPWLLQFERIRGPRNLGEVPCDPNSPEFTWEDFATPQGGEVIIAKSSWSSTSNTALMDILRVAGIETVLVCGLITSVCVQHSAFGIFEAGYRTLLVTDSCADRGKARHEAALALYGDYMYELITSEDLESEDTGLIPAKPVWLMLDSKTNMVRANAFPVAAHTNPWTPPAPVLMQSGAASADEKATTTTVMNAVARTNCTIRSDSTVSTASCSSSSTVSSAYSNTTTDSDDHRDESSSRPHNFNVIHVL
ncbi:isochorismatase hydrolase [Nitzschia inconspicua]|uniref:Isochorismatase hydrolase n=1 Tax=Nitzschia inconspicua TaxID=303405 RepID=A0A9K3PRT3_9STRA|nr:isochorismatase hydrolase [Nitzschia inconspicua]